MTIPAYKIRCGIWLFIVRYVGGQQSRESKDEQWLFLDKQGYFCEDHRPMEF